MYESNVKRIVGCFGTEKRFEALKFEADELSEVAHDVNSSETAIEKVIAFERFKKSAAKVLLLIDQIAYAYDCHDEIAEKAQEIAERQVSRIKATPNPRLTESTDNWIMARFQRKE